MTNNNINFLGNKNNKRPKHKSINLIGSTNNFKHTSKVSYLGLKQAKRTNFGGLRGPYGDKDFDGSINKWDCSPNNTGKDGVLKEIMKTLTFGRKEREARLKKNQEVGERLTAQRELKYAKVREFAEKAPEGLSERARREFANQEYERTKPKTDDNIKELLNQQQKLYLEKLKRIKPTNQSRPQRYSRVLRTASVILPRGAVPSQQRRAFQTSPGGRKVYKGSAGAKGGRPVGSYTHIIPGVGPVGVYEWRKWMRQQNALRRFRGQQLSQTAQEQLNQRMTQQQQYKEAVQNYEQQGQAQPQAQPQEQQQYQEPQQQYPTQAELQQQAAQYSQYNYSSANTSDAKDESELPTQNKFSQQLRREQAMVQRDIYDREKNEQPKNFVQKTIEIKRLNQQHEREFSQRNNILNAHKAMLTAQQNSINFLDTEGNILDTRNNNIMAKRPDHIDILNTGRPNVLQGQRLRQNIQEMNPLNAERLNFGSV